MGAQICVVLAEQFLFLFVRSRNGHSPECIMGRNGWTQKIIQGTEGSLAKSHHGANSAHQNGEGEQEPTRYMYTAVSWLLSLSCFLFSVHDRVDHCKNMVAAAVLPYGNYCSTKYFCLLTNSIIVCIN